MSGYVVICEFTTLVDAEACRELMTGISTCVPRVWKKDARPSKAPMIGTRLGKLVYDFCTPGRQWYADDLFAHVEEHGYATSSITSTLSGLVKTGHIRRIRPGLYERCEP
jgi:hypothetical protein